MRGILRAAERDAIFRPPDGGEEHTVPTDDGGLAISLAAAELPWWSRTANRRTLLSGEPARHTAQEERRTPLPPHNWLQHGLGDAEHWGREVPEQPEQEPEEDEQAGRLAALLRWAAGPPELPQNLEYAKPASGSTHEGSEIYRHPVTQENWLVKHPPGKSADFLAEGDVATNQLATMSGLEAPTTFKTDLGKGPASAQYMYPGATDAFHGQVNPEKLGDDDLLTIQKHHALDWLIGNHDSHERQFIRTPEHGLVGIDKGQAFKYFNHDRLDWNYHPNTKYQEHEPVANTIYRNFAKGGREINDPRDGELGKYVQGLQSIPDEDYAAMLRPYAESAAKVARLGTVPRDFYEGNNEEGRFDPNDVEGFLAAAVGRKNSLSDDMGGLYDKAMAHRMTGTKIAMAAPDPALLKSLHQTLGSHGGKVYADPQGQWLVKKPPSDREFMVPLDQATANLQQHAGLESPETHAIPWRGGNATAIKMLPPGTQQAWHKPPHLAQVHPDDLLTLQKHQALDWLIANHDGHVGNFLRTPQGSLVGIDKGQAAKYYGRDRLDNTFHPNYYAREPVYNNLWREFGAGKPGAMHDPRQGELGEFVKRLQDIPDHELKQMFRPYAEHAAEAGRLAKIKDKVPGGVDRKRGLGPATIPPNDPEAFLGAMVRRKNNLSDDLGAYYDSHARSRQQAAYGQGPQFAASRRRTAVPVTQPQAPAQVSVAQPAQPQAAAKPSQSNRDFAHSQKKPYWEAQGFEVGDHAADAHGEHQNGALDIMVPDTASGDRVLQEILKDPSVQGAIWNNKTYGYGHGSTPKDYGSTGGPTDRHEDHVHVWYKADGSSAIGGSPAQDGSGGNPNAPGGGTPGGGSPAEMKRLPAGLVGPETVDPRGGKNVGYDLTPALTSVPGAGGGASLTPRRRRVPPALRAAPALRRTMTPVRASNSGVPTSRRRCVATACLRH